MTMNKPSRNEDEYFARRDAELLRRRRAELRATQESMERHSHYLKCPKDGGDLGTREFHGVQVETCPRCGGIWVDADEIELVLEHHENPGILGRLLQDVFETLRHPLADEEAALPRHRDRNLD
jgi:Zn-finger nucleic acid-binding protein